LSPRFNPFVAYFHAENVKLNLNQGSEVKSVQKSLSTLLYIALLLALIMGWTSLGTLDLSPNLFRMAPSLTLPETQEIPSEGY
jgi:hypothetical protein